MFQPRYPGMRWRIVYGAYSGISAHAVNTLQQSVQRYFPYVVEVLSVAAAEATRAQCHNILLGTPQSHPWIADLLAQGIVRGQEQPEGYTLTCTASPWAAEARLLVISGADEKGVLNGVYDLDAQVLSVLVTPDSPAQARTVFDALPEAGGLRVAGHSQPRPLDMGLCHL